MKLLCFIGAILFLALTACHRPVETCHGASLTSELVSIDSLMQSRPDSALALLQASPKEDPYYQLLLSEALYKNDSAQLNRPELMEAMAHYDSLGCPFLSARCHYMNGVGYYEMDSVVEACEEYLKALEIMEEHYKEKDLVGYKAKFMALLNTHLCGLFSDQYLPQQAISFGKRSLIYYDKCDAELWQVAWILDEIGIHHAMIQQWDSADYYYNKALDILPDSNNLTFRDITSAQSFSSYYRNKTANASLIRLHQMLALSDNERERLSRCLLIGEIYFQECIWDSARYYLEDVYDLTKQVEPKILAAQYLRDICLRTKDSLGMNCYIQFLSQQTEVGDIKASVHSQMTEFYRVYAQNKKESQFKQQSTKHIQTVCIIVTVILTVLVIKLVINRRQQKHIKIQKEDAEKQLLTERYAHKIQEAALSGRLRESNKSLRIITKQYETYKVLQNRISDDKGTATDFNAFMGNPVCKDILELVEKMNFKPKMDCLDYKSCALDKKQLKALVEAADTHLDRFTIRLCNTYPALTEDDTKYCCLYLLGLNEADIAALMQRAYPTICERNRKIKRIMNIDGELSVFLRGMV